MSIKQISVFAENKPGTMKALTDTLAQSGVNLRALSLAETKDFGIVRLIVDNVYQATTTLRDADFIHNITSVIGAAIPDEPGSLGKVLGILADANVNVEYMYAFLGGKKDGHAYMIFRVEDEAAAASALKANGIQLVEQDDIENL